MKGDVEIPFEEILEKAKAGDPKAQTEVRTAMSGAGSGRGLQDSGLDKSSTANGGGCRRSAL